MGVTNGSSKHRLMFGILLLAGILLRTSYCLKSKAEATEEAKGKSKTKPEAYARSVPEPEPAELEAIVETEVESEGEIEPEAEIGDENFVCLFVVLYSIIIVIILVGNITVAVTIGKSEELRSNTSNLYLLSLVTARASIAVFVIPARITAMFSEAYLGSFLCKLCHFAALGSSSASIFSIVAIAMVKYFQLVRHETSETLSMKKSVIIIVTIWLVGFMYATRALVANDLVVVVMARGPIWSCTVDQEFRYLNRYFIIVDVVCLFLIPLIVIISCYYHVIKKLSATREEAKDVAAVDKIDRQALRAIRMLVILMFLFAVCTASPMVLSLYTLWGGAYFESYIIVETATYLFSYSNAWFNVVVFAYFRDDLRAAFWEMCSRGACCRRQNTITPSCESLKDSESKEMEKTGVSLDDHSQNADALRMMEF